MDPMAQLPYDLGLAAKVRPALVISVPANDEDRAPVTIAPHTTSPRGSRFEADVPVPFLRSGVFDAQSLVTIPRPRCGWGSFWQPALSNREHR
jgi:mRNA interferase MazF